MVEEWYSGIMMADGKRTAPLQQLEERQRRKQATWRAHTGAMSTRVNAMKKIIYTVLDAAGVSRISPDRPSRC